MECKICISFSSFFLKGSCAQTVVLKKVDGFDVIICNLHIYNKTSHIFLKRKKLWKQELFVYDFTKNKTKNNFEYVNIYKKH